MTEKDIDRWKELSDSSQEAANRGETARAEELLRLALSVAETLEAHGVYVVITRYKIGELLQKTDRVADAAKEYEDALRILEAKVPGAQDICVALVLLTRCYMDMGKFEKAEELCLKALAITEANLINRDRSPETDDVLIFIKMLKPIMLAQGKHDQFRSECNKAMRVIGNFYESKTASQGLLEVFIGDSFADEDDWTRALQHYTEGLNLQERYLKSNHPDIAETLQKLSCAYGAIGSARKAEILARLSKEM